MNAQAIIEAAAAEGLIVDLSQSGSLKVIGEKKVVNLWRPLLQQHKTDIINLLSKEPGGVVPATRPGLPRWCRIDCPGLEMIHLPKEGEVAGCVNPFTESWRRLGWMTECPAMGRSSLGQPCRKEAAQARHYDSVYESQCDNQGNKWH